MPIRQPSLVQKVAVARVFVSYRRADTALLADLLAERLSERFEVFVDVETIAFGDAFMSQIQRGISSADVVLVLIGASWDPSRLHGPQDVVAYELRVAREFGRRVVPVVAAPGVPPVRELLPDDLRWMADLNAFVLPAPPQHRLAMTQLADAIEEAAKRDSTVKDRTLFAVPQNAEMLKVVRGNVEFTERALFETPKSAEPVQLCLVDPRRPCVWVASWHYIEIYDLATGSRTHHAEPGAEWMQPIGAGVMASRSSPGYHSPDGIDFWRLQYKEREVERIPAGHTWYWGMPPIALSPDEAVLATYADDKRRELTFRSSANGEEIGRCALGATASSLCFDANGRRLFAFGAVERRDWLLTAVDVESGSSLWTRKVQSDLLNEPLPSDPRVQFRDSQSRRRAHVVAYWAANDSLLVSTGSSVSELDARSGEWRRTIVAVEDRLQCLATDPSTSFSCLGNSSELLIWGPRTETIAAVEHLGDRCVDCSIANGHVAGLIGAGDERRLLTASIHGLGNRAATQAGAVSNAEIAR